MQRNYSGCKKVIFWERFADERPLVTGRAVVGVLEFTRRGTADRVHFQDERSGVALELQWLVQLKFRIIELPPATKI